MRHGSLFSGIGGFDLAAEWMGWGNIFHCEWMEFPRKVLDYHFPNADSHIDICKTDFKKYANKIDILTGGFPCQPFSMAGKRKGTEDERYLWGEMLRAIQEIKPKFVIAENVFGITNIDGGMVFEQVCLDLEAQGYEVQPFIIPACSKNAPHRRDRVWFVAYASSNGGSKNTKSKHRTKQENKEQLKCLHGTKDATNTNSGRLERSAKSRWNSINVERESEFRNATDTNCDGLNKRNGNDEINAGEGGKYALNDFNEDAMHTNSTMRKGEYIGQKREREFNRSNSRNGINNFQNFPTQSPICGGDDGLPAELDGITFSKWRAESIKGYGNAIVPQVAYEIFKALEKL